MLPHYRKNFGCDVFYHGVPLEHLEVVPHFHCESKLFSVLQVQRLRALN